MIYQARGSHECDPYVKIFIAFVLSKKRLKEAAGLKFTQIHRDATIQRFEFCFELAWKTLQAYIRDQGLDCKSPKGCFRVAAELGIIKNIEDWFGYLEARNLIAHTDNEELADKVYKAAIKFPAEIDKLLRNKVVILSETKNLSLQCVG